MLASAAPDSVAPVHINNVYAPPSYGTEIDFNYRGRIDVGFTNVSPVEATDIVFDIENSKGAVINQLEDVGSFAQGVAIHHNFNDDALDPNQQVVVEEVTFADGTKWSNTNATPLRSRRQATVGMLDQNDFPFLHE
jgi:hypothetical protein